MYSILIIENDETSCFYMESFLKKEGFDVRCALDGQSGLDLLYKKRPDLILCDIMMPDMDGHTVLETVRKQQAFADIPFIFVTGRVDRADVRQGMNEGADDYLPKPVLADALLAAVNARILRHETILQHQGDPVFKEEESTLHKKKITKREREVLLKVGQGATSKQIAGQLGVSLKTIEMHRSNLMKKLGSANVIGLARWAAVAERM